MIVPAAGVTLNLAAPNNAATTINAVMGGAGNFLINSGGTGSVQLSARNLMSGNLTLNNSQLDLATQTSLGTGTLTVNNGTLSTPTFIVPSGYGPSLPQFANAININAGGLKLGGNFGFTLGGNISGPGGITLSPANLLSGVWTLAGSNSFTGPLTVSGPAGGITNTLVVNSPASLGAPSTILVTGAGARIAFVGNASTFTVNAPMGLFNGAAISAISTTTNAKIVYAGKISGTGGLTVLPGGSLTLAGANDFQGGLNLLGGTTAVNSFVNLGASGTITFAGGSLVLNPGFGITTHKLNVAASGSTLYNFDDVTLNGLITNASSQGFTKAGAGNLTLTGSNTFSGPLAIASGTITATGPSGIITGGVGSITVNAGAGLVLDNTFGAIQRVSSSGSIILAGGNLSFLGNGTQNSSTIVNTPLVIGQSINQSGAGYDVIDLQATEDTATQVKFSSLTRGANGGTQVLFTGVRLGQFAIASPAPGATNFSFTTSPAGQLVNGIFPWAITDALGASGNDFATYSVGNGIQPLATYTSDFAGGLTANLAVTSVTLATGAGNVSCNSLKLAGGTINAAGGTLNINSGAILSTGAPSAITGGTILIGTSTNNTASAPTANFFCVSDLTVSSNLTNFTPGSGEPSGIAKSGAGVLLLSGSNSYTGPTRILNGTLRLGSGTAISSLSDVFVNPGATLELNGFSSTVGALNQTAPMLATGNTNYGTIVIGAASLTAGGNDNSSVFAGNIIGTGTFTKQGLGTLELQGSQAFTGAVTLAKGSLVLDTHSTRGTAFTSASTINLGQGSLGTSADLVLGFNFGLENFSVPLVVQPATLRTATLKFIQGPAGTPGTTFSSPIAIAGGIGGTIGLIVDSGGGATLSGPISGTGSLMTVSTASSLAGGSTGFAINISGSNSYTGTTTLAAPVNLWGSANAFGGATSAIQLGSPTGLDNPELSSAVGGLTLTRNIIVNDSTNAVAAFATIGGRAPAGSNAGTYSGTISIAGRRSKLILYSLDAPIAFTGIISGAQAGANVQVGGTLGTGLEFTNSNVTLSGANTFAGGTRLYCGTLSLGSSTTLAGSTITSGPVGTGTFFIGTSGLPGATEPTITASGAARTIANPIVVSNNFSIAAGNGLTMSGTVDLSAAARIVSVNNVATFSGAIIGVAGSAFIKDGVGTLQLSGSLNHSGATVVNAGRLSILSTQRLQGSLNIGPGANVTMATGGAIYLTTPAISIDAANAGVLDLADDDAVIDYTGLSPLASIRDLLAAGYAGGAWTGPGIDSSAAAAVAANASNFNKTAIGYVEASAFNTMTFDGQPVDDTSVLLRYTLTGDTNLNGTVDMADFTALSGNFNLAGSFWQQGDFNFDGVVNALDFNAIASNFGLTQSSVPLGSDGVLVPEPVLLGMFALLFPFSRRRRSFRGPVHAPVQTVAR